MAAVEEEEEGEDAAACDALDEEMFVMLPT